MLLYAYAQSCAACSSTKSQAQIIEQIFEQITNATPLGGFFSIVFSKVLGSLLLKTYKPLLLYLDYPFASVLVVLVG
jgi:hypothetical protein